MKRQRRSPQRDEHVKRKKSVEEVLHEHYGRMERPLTSRLFENIDNLYADGPSAQNSSTNNAISKIIQEIQSTLETLELKFVDHGAKEFEAENSTGHSRVGVDGQMRSGKFPKVGGRVGSRCFIESITGVVNCTDVIYDDGKTWYRSKSQIDTLIKVLKKKITHLKDIKKQLREESKQQQQKHLNYWNNQRLVGNRSKGRRRGSPFDFGQQFGQHRHYNSSSDHSSRNKPKNYRNFTESKRCVLFCKYSSLTNILPFFLDFTNFDNPESQESDGKLHHESGLDLLQQNKSPDFADTKPGRPAECYCEQDTNRYE